MRTAPRTGQLGRTGTMRLVPIPARFRDGKLIAHRTDTVSLDDLDRVRQDPVVRSALLTLKLPLLRCKWNIFSDDAVVSAFCQRVVQPFMRELLWNLLTALDFGFSVQELVWESRDVDLTGGLANAPDAQRIVLRGAWVIQRLAPLDPQLVYPLVDRFGQFAGVRQYIDGVDIDAEKLLHWAVYAEFDEVYGYPVAKPAIPFWEMKMQALEDAALYHNIYAVPTKKGFAPPGQTEVGVGADGEPVFEDNMEYLRQLLEDLRSAHNIVLPASLGDGRQWDVEAFDVPPPISYPDWIAFLDDQIRLALGVPKLSVSTSETGTYNLGVAQIDLFLDNEQALLSQIEEVINQQLLPRLVAYNFGAGAAEAQIRMQLDMRFLEQMIRGMVGQLAAGNPVRTADGMLLVPDWEKIAEDASVPVRVVEEIGYMEEFSDEEDTGRAEEDGNATGAVQQRE